MKKIPAILGGMITLGVVGASSFFFAQGFFSKSDFLGRRFTLKDSKKDYGVKISYYNFQKDGPGLFGNTEQENIDGYKALGKRLKEVMYHGPEIDQLNEIVFGDTNIINQSANGLYIPNTKQIFINIATFEPYWNNKNLKTEDIINSLTGVIVHEYGHHIMNIYNNSMKPNDNLSTKDIYHTVLEGQASPRIQQGWNKKFMDSFKKALHYDRYDDPFYPKHKGEFGSTESNKEPGWKEKTGEFGSMKSEEGEVFSMGNGKNSNAAHLFHNANVKIQGKINAKKAFFVNQVHDNEGRTVKALINARSVFNPRKASDNDSLHYIYSADELTTRQMEQLMYYYPVSIKDSKRWGRMVPADVTSGEGFSLETFVSDLMRNYIIEGKGKSGSLELGLFKDPKLNKNLLYMSDNVWGGSHVNFNNTEEGKNPTYTEQMSTKDKLQKAYESLIGIDKSINQIYAKNTSSIYNSITSDSDNPWKKEWLNQIKISGFIPRGHEAFYKGLVIGKGLYKFSDNKSSQKAFLTSKSTIFSEAQSVFSKSYILNDFINLNNLKSEEKIYWWNDKNKDNKLDKGEKLPMKENNISKDNRLTTYRQFMTEGKFAEILTKGKNKDEDKSEEEGVYLCKGGY